MGPFTCLTGHGWGFSISHMVNGKTADDHFITEFFPDGANRYIESLKTETNVSGW
jgi:hypothetical protein